MTAITRDTVAGQGSPYGQSLLAADPWTWWGTFAKPSRRFRRNPAPRGQGEGSAPEPRRPSTVELRRIDEPHDTVSGLKATLAIVATAYWYFTLATLTIALIVPAAAGWNATTVMSDSMAPAISQGDVVAFAQPDGSLLDVGTIIQFEDPARADSTITHRIAAVNPDGTYQTKGDANPAADSTHVPKESVTGVARMVSSYAGLPHFWLATGQYGWLVAWVLATAAAAMAMVLPPTSEPGPGATRPRRTTTRLPTIALPTFPVTRARMQAAASASGRPSLGS